MNPASSFQEYTLAIFPPPYDRFEPIDLGWHPQKRPVAGHALVWWLNRNGQEAEFEWLRHRPAGLPLFVVLPAPIDIPHFLPLLSKLDAIDPRSVLPAGRIVNALHLRELLRTAPRNFAGTVTTYLIRRRLLHSPSLRAEVHRIFESAPEVSSISKLARRLYTSRRTLGRHFAAAGLPVPSHWLQFARLLHASIKLQNEETTSVFRIAGRAGYPDGFTMSNQMMRLIGSRPTAVRSLLGWEWIIERWLSREVRAGRIDPERHRVAIGSYEEDDGTLAETQVDPERPADQADE